MIVSLAFSMAIYYILIITYSTIFLYHAAQLYIIRVQKSFFISLHAIILQIMYEMSLIKLNTKDGT
jgi:hypothetical protein